MASATVSVSAETTFTASYSNVSDTCTVTVPAHNYSLQFSQDTYVDSGFGASLRCTLTDNGTPVSGETVKFTWFEGGLSLSDYATTNSNGVAAKTITVMNNTAATATYEDATATCTIIYDDPFGGDII